MSTTLIPKGFIRIAHSELMNCGTGTLYFNKDRQRFILVVDDEIVGGFPINRLECVLHVIKDVYEMRGRYGEV